MPLSSSIRPALRQLFSRPGLPLLALLMVTAVWLTSMPTQIAIANDPLPDPTGEFEGILQLMDDSGEFVIAWHTWGVTHAPGYPLLSLLANIGVRLLDPLKLYPIIAANLLSFLFAIGAFVLMVWPFSRLNGSGTAVAAAFLLPAFGILVWLYAVVAEAYAFGLLLAFGSFSLAWSLGQMPTRRKLLLLGLLFGLAVGHHRTLLFLAPALLLAAWPAHKLGWRHWLEAGLLAAASLLIYLYLPLIAWAGSPWVYGRSPTTWVGFADAFWAREYSARLTPPTSLPEIFAALNGRLRYLAQEMSVAGLGLGLTGFLPGLAHPKTRRLALVLLLAFAGYWLAPVSQGLLIRSYMMILVASLTLAAAWGIGLVALGQWQHWLPTLGLLLTVGVAANNFVNHRDYILFHTKDSLGPAILRDTTMLPGETPLVGEIWGPRYFPLAYGKLVTGELAHIQLVDLRADLSGLPTPPPSEIFVNQSVLYAAPAPLWEEKLGTAVSLSSQGHELIAIRGEPEIRPIARQPLAISEEIQLVSGTAVLNSDQSLNVQLTWQARQAPRVDYSIFVHVTDQPQITGPDDLLAQGDRTHPVHGFYPTTHWQPGEWVRDNYLIPLPEDRTPLKIFVGLYTVGGDGSFTNHLVQELPIDSE
ncbi:protein O-mannosyl-transferase family [Candidatus Leptofilum sp.]|uniref:protein O-mannosyl-transferase family n=1 Tax=Candidatus Leptofilum sp. TaxID=3241576 RepID=UPI003B5B23E6